MTDFPVNNKRIESLVRGMLDSGRITHAILIECELDAERNALTAYIAKSCLCSNPPLPCNACRDCHLADVGTHPDIFTVNPADGKKNITVSQIRELRSEAYVKAHSALRRVFIIDGADKMNEQAQNALLKVLEEPPQNVVFLLTASSRTLLLETIVSRCALLTLNNGKPVDDGDDIMSAAEQFIKYMLDGNELEMLRLVFPYEKDRVAAGEFFEKLRMLIALQIKKSQSNTTLAKSLVSLYNYTGEVLERLKTNVNLSLVFSATVCRIKSLEI